MPIYEYQCEKCQEILEISQKMSDPLLTECPKCQGQLKKLVSRTSFQLKGGGWYKTDYKKTSGPSSTPAAESPKTETSPTETKAPEKPKGGGGCGSGGCGHGH